MLAATLLVGCFTNPKTSNDLVPKSKIDWDKKNGRGSVELPKDHDIGYAHIMRDSNGVFTLTLSNLTSRMNPDVINSAGASYAEALKQQALRDKAMFEFLNRLGPAVVGAAADGAIPGPGR